MSRRRKTRAPVEATEYVFSRPAWRKVVPLFAAALVWVPFLLWKFVAGLPPETKVGEYGSIALLWLQRHGLREAYVFYASVFLSAAAIVWWYHGFERLIIGPKGIGRRGLLGGRVLMKWEDLDEIMIDRIETVLEGGTEALNVLTVYSRRRKFPPWRRRLRVTSSEFGSFQFAERLAAQVAIPAISKRLLRELTEEAGSVTFSPSQHGLLVRVTLMVLAGVACLMAASETSLWPGALVYVQLGVGLTGVLLFLASAIQLVQRQLTLTKDHLTISLMGLMKREVPLEQIADVRVQANQLRVLARPAPGKRPRQIFKTNQFIRNRGVLLHLLRMLVKRKQAERRGEDVTPGMPEIAPMPVFPTEEPAGAVPVYAPAPGLPPAAAAAAVTAAATASQESPQKSGDPTMESAAYDTMPTSEALALANAEAAAASSVESAEASAATGRDDTVVSNEVPDTLTAFPALAVGTAVADLPAAPGNSPDPEPESDDAGSDTLAQVIPLHLPDVADPAEKDSPTDTASADTPAAAEPAPAEVPAAGDTLAEDNAAAAEPPARQAPH